MRPGFHPLVNARPAEKVAAQGKDGVTRRFQTNLRGKTRRSEKTFPRAHLTLHSNPDSFSLGEDEGDFFSSLLFPADADGDEGGRFVSFSVEGDSGEAMDEPNMKKI